MGISDLLLLSYHVGLPNRVTCGMNPSITNIDFRSSIDGFSLAHGYSFTIVVRGASPVGAWNQGEKIPILLDVQSKVVFFPLPSTIAPLSFCTVDSSYLE